SGACAPSNDQRELSELEPEPELLRLEELRPLLLPLREELCARLPPRSRLVSIWLRDELLLPLLPWLLWRDELEDLFDWFAMGELLEISIGRCGRKTVC